MKKATENIHRKVIIRLRIYALITSIILGITIYDIILDKIEPGLAIIGLIGGIGVGFLFGRIYKIYRHEDTQQVMSQIDTLGVVFLVVYIGIEISKKYILGYRIHGTALSTLSLIILAGLLSGRLLSMLHRIRKALSEQDTDS